MRGVCCQTKPDPAVFVTVTLTRRNAGSLIVVPPPAHNDIRNVAEPRRRVQNDAIDQIDVVLRTQLTWDHLSKPFGLWWCKRPLCCFSVSGGEEAWPGRWEDLEDCHLRRQENLQFIQTTQISGGISTIPQIKSVFTPTEEKPPKLHESDEMFERTLCPRWLTTLHNQFSSAVNQRFDLLMTRDTAVGELSNVFDVNNQNVD